MELEYFEKDIVRQCLGYSIWFCTTQVSMPRKDRSARNVHTSPLPMARYKRTLVIATFMANAAKYSPHCRGKDMREVVLAPFLRKGHNLVVSSKVIVGLCR